MQTQTLTPTLSRSAGEGATETRRSFRVPSPAKRERDGVRVSPFLSPNNLNVEA